MFGQNEIVGRAFFKDAPKDSLLVTSMFFTIQGEGPFAGRPAFFIRLAKCNLQCNFCDTFFDQGEWMEFEAIDAKIHNALQDYFKNSEPPWAYGDKELIKGPRTGLTTLLWNKPRKMVLVVTGGEPGLQNKNLMGFFDYMAPQFENIQVETNGMFPLYATCSKVTIVCSPKCNVLNHYIKPRNEILRDADCLKFVVTSDWNNPYHGIPDWAHQWAAETGKPIFISPMNVYNDLPQKAKELQATRQGATLEQRSTANEVISFWETGLLDMDVNQSNHEYAAKYALQHGYIFNMQMHLFASMA